MNEGDLKIIQRYCDIWLEKSKEPIPAYTLVAYAARGLGVKENTAKTYVLAAKERGFISYEAGCYTPNYTK